MDTYNQIELKNDGGTSAIRTGGTYEAADLYQKDVVYNVEVVWEPSANKITSTLSRDGAVVSAGYRTGTKNAYEDIPNWVMRCEDGAIEIDHFSYSDGTTTFVITVTKA